MRCVPTVSCSPRGHSLGGAVALMVALRLVKAERSSEEEPHGGTTSEKDHAQGRGGAAASSSASSEAARGAAARTTRGGDDDDDGRALDLRVMTFGAPHVGDAAFAAFAEATLGADRARFQRRGAVLSLSLSRVGRRGGGARVRAATVRSILAAPSLISHGARATVSPSRAWSPRAVVAVRFFAPRWHEGLCC